MRPYIASYLASRACADDPDCRDVEDMKALYRTYSHSTNYIFCTTVVFEAMASVIGGKLELYLGAEYCALLGSSILSLGCALTHYTVGNIYGVTITYGIIFGFGAGLAFVLSFCLCSFSTVFSLSTLFLSCLFVHSYPGVVVCIMRWWPNNIGIATGFVCPFPVSFLKGFRYFSDSMEFQFSFRYVSVIGSYSRFRRSEILRVRICL